MIGEKTKVFTGIITHQGRVVALSGHDDRDLWIESELPLENTAIGASVAHSGVCLTVVEKEANRYRVQASGETLARTTLGQWEVGTSVNLERSLTLGAELGGHIVFGHVDGVGRNGAIDKQSESWLFRIAMPKALAPLIAVKGSVAVDGISLTVTALDEETFSLVIIPHSFEVTTLSDRKIGDPVNLEADMLARYVQRQLSFAKGS